ncbi:hypothetical protein A3206_08075 [Candidatus Methanomassiliicoccus intestinalis]|uniref:Ribbon-helix-helix protein CopG domain-containing protein n=1 Tax=Methanomassiliicoccus intestinalis (strain Issoire-Mx1) TaxID=1295009 RepID=R9T8F4_METII|nr:hypothetical protein [Candidatus Methanomassiliicoccus intestinalis]AGN26985.1 hypothetical protein MMINT_16940 [Candidatus Methanomassiliicoccus intestinalis Issoire-Mx1]TQS79153.1 MAG: hypothetical protein A3206_08075 [Candidatus Methanomassiliicoccus intestinalis]
MPTKVPPKKSFRVLVPEELEPKIDKLVEEGHYNGKSDFAMRLIRDYIDKKEEEETVRKKYEILKAEKKLKESSNDEKE